MMLTWEMFNMINRKWSLLIAVSSKTMKGAISF